MKRTQRKAVAKKTRTQQLVWPADEPGEGMSYAEVMKVMNEDPAELSASTEERSLEVLAKNSVQKGDWLNAILVYNSLRKLSPSVSRYVNRVIEMLDRFYEENKTQLSHDDLVVFSEPIERLLNYYSYHTKVTWVDIDRAKRLRDRVKAQIPVSKSRPDSDLSLRVKQIYDSLYPDDMSMDEVRAEFARLVAPLIRAKYAEKRSKNSNKQISKPPKHPSSPPRPAKSSDSEKGKMEDKGAPRVDKKQDDNSDNA